MAERAPAAPAAPAPAEAAPAEGAEEVPKELTPKQKQEIKLVFGINFLANELARLTALKLRDEFLPAELRKTLEETNENLRRSIHATLFAGKNIQDMTTWCPTAAFYHEQTGTLMFSLMVTPVSKEHKFEPPYALRKSHPDAARNWKAAELWMKKIINGTRQVWQKWCAHHGAPESAVRFYEDPATLCFGLDEKVPVRLGFVGFEGVAQNYTKGVHVPEDV